MSKKHYGTSNVNVLATTVTDTVEMPDELSERQRRIVKYRLRGLTQTAIAQIEKVSQPMISKELKAIRVVFAERGAQIDQDVVVGETVHLYQEIEQQAWSLFHEAKSTKDLSNANKSLGTIMSSRERHIKLLLDLGLLKRAAIEHKHEVAPFLERWKEQSSQDKRILIESVIDTQLSDLAPPLPPIDAEIILDEEE